MKKKNEISLVARRKKAAAVFLIVLIVIGAFSLVYLDIYPRIRDGIREKRILAIYSSLHLSNTYYLQKESIFGEKRPYDVDKSRSFSSSKEYLHGATVDTTMNELKKAIIDAGFTFYQEPYPGSAFRELIFKSKEGEYIRVTVSSKPRDDNIQNKVLMHIKLTDADYMNPNLGPSNVTIKVNLDDNNE